MADGRSGRIVGVDPIAQTYQVMTSDHKSLRLKSSDIQSLQKEKSKDYQASGIDSSDSKKLSIEDTPFDLDQDK